jgi:hypothetical protein
MALAAVAAGAERQREVHPVVVDRQEIVGKMALLLFPILS